MVATIDMLKDLSKASFLPTIMPGAHGEMPKTEAPKIDVAATYNNQEYWDHIWSSMMFHYDHPELHKYLTPFVGLYKAHTQVALEGEDLLKALFENSIFDARYRGVRLGAGVIGGKWWSEHMDKLAKKDKFHKHLIQNAGGIPMYLLKDKEDSEVEIRFCQHWASSVLQIYDQYKKKTPTQQEQADDEDID